MATKLSTSSLDRIDGAPRLMMWKDEQRAVGGLMRTPGTVGVIGFEVFDKVYETRFSRWFGFFAEDLLMPGIEHGMRLQAVSESSDLLIARLDKDRVYEGRV